MKKWYVITGVLGLLLLISLGSCGLNSYSNSVKVAGLEAELSSAKVELDSAKTQLTESKAELIQLKATQEISFGNGLKVSELSLPTSDWDWEVSGKVQNTGNLPMKSVYVIVAAYDRDGTLKDMSSSEVFNLYPNEIGEWTAYPGSADSYAYAFGNK